MLVLAWWWNRRLALANHCLTCVMAMLSWVAMDSYQLISLKSKPCTCGFVPLHNAAAGVTAWVKLFSLTSSWLSGYGKSLCAANHCCSTATVVRGRRYALSCGLGDDPSPFFAIMADITVALSKGAWCMLQDMCIMTCRKLWAREGVMVAWSGSPLLMNVSSSEVVRNKGSSTETKAPLSLNQMIQSYMVRWIEEYAVEGCVWEWSQRWLSVLKMRSHSSNTWNTRFSLIILSNSIF